MVLSTSSAQAIAQGGSPYAGFQKQLLGVVVGLPLMWIAAGHRPVLFRAAAYPMVAVSVLGLLLVLAVGHTVNGGERWIKVAGLPGPAVRVRQAGLRALGRRPARPQGEGGPARRVAAPADPAAARGRDLQHAGDARRRPRHHVHPAGHLPRPALGDRHPGPAVRRHARADGLRDGHPDHRGVLPAAADHRLPAPAGQLADGRLADARRASTRWARADGSASGSARAG